MTMYDRRIIARDLLTYATNGGNGRTEDDLVYQTITEGRDVGAMRKKYSSCADLAHWLLYRLGCRTGWVNRAEHRGWLVGQNVSLLFGSPAARSWSETLTLDCGDILIVWPLSQSSRAHVACVYAYEGGVLTLAEYGTPGGKMSQTCVAWNSGQLSSGATIHRAISLDNVPFSEDPQVDDVGLPADSSDWLRQFREKI